MCHCSYIVAAALDGGTQVISFILNFAVFGASGTAHSFPQWWGNGTFVFYTKAASYMKM